MIEFKEMRKETVENLKLIIMINLASFLSNIVLQLLAPLALNVVPCYRWVW